VDYDPKTEQFGEWIHRAVANYSQSGAYTGYTGAQNSSILTNTALNFINIYEWSNHQVRIVE
jgi:hypothetical protein